MLLRTFEGEAESFTYNGAADDKEALKSWVKAEKVPPYVEFTEENQEAIFGSGIPLNVCLPPSPTLPSAHGSSCQGISYGICLAWWMNRIDMT